MHVYTCIVRTLLPTPCSDGRSKHVPMPRIKDMGANVLHGLPNGAALSSWGTTG